MVLEKLVVAERDCQELQTAQSKLKESESNMRAMREEVSALQSGSRSELRKVKKLLVVLYDMLDLFLLDKMRVLWCVSTVPHCIILYYFVFFLSHAGENAIGSIPV